MLEKILYWVLAIATIIGGIAVGDDYICDKCIKQFCDSSSCWIWGIAILSLIGVLVFVYYYWKKWSRKPVDMEEPRGQISLDSPFYVERPPIEANCYKAIVKPKALIRVKAPQQMGKSSLLARILHHAEQKGFRTVSLSFQTANPEIFADLDQFLQWFCRRVTKKLGLTDKLAECWQSVLGSKDNCTDYFEDYVFVEITEPLVVGLDEVNLIFEHKKVAVGFLGLLRSWHEKSTNDKIWQQFRLVLTYSQEVFIHIDAKESPFNVGTAFELEKFDSEQMQDLIQRYKLGGSEEPAKQLMSLVGGHPYLLHFGLYQIATGQWSWKKFLTKVPNEYGPYGEHLRHHLLNLQAHPELARAAKTIMIASNSIPIQEIGTTNTFQLRSMGLITVENDMVTPLGDLYRQFFAKRL